MGLSINDTAPDFEADTTQGKISFHDWIGDSWAVLFSHPKDFTPVCTTELGYMAKIQPDFEKRNVKIIGLSVDATNDHEAWADDIEETQGSRPGYPIIGDADFNVAKLYGMLPAATDGDAKSRTPADNQTVRNVFVIGPDKKIKLILVYPMTTGRNFDEVLRVIDSLQLTAKHRVSTPVNWKQGEDVIIAGSVNNDEAKEIFGSWKEPKPYIRIVPQPKCSACTRVVILGAGFAGLELATRLSDDVGDLVEVTVIDASDAFVFGFTKLDVMFGRRTLDEVRLPYRLIDKPSVDVRQETVVSIDPDNKRVVTNAGTYDADVLVIALGADLAPEATAGFTQVGFEFYSPEGAARVSHVLREFTGGAVVIAVLGGFFKCPPAPYETAFMVHDYLSERGLRDASTIHLVTPMPKPIPISDEVSNAIVALMDERGIEHWHATATASVDPATKTLHLKDERELRFDLLLGVPVHVAPPVVVEAGLTDDGWIGVDIATFATKFPDVFAVGDITSAPVPRAGVIAEGEAVTLADVLVDRVRGGATVTAFEGAVKCYMEMGQVGVSLVDVNFLAGPKPVAVFTPPSREGVVQKERFAAARRQRWFGVSS